MATWVGVIVATNGRADLWQALEPLGVRGQGEVTPHVLIDCGRSFGAVEELGKTIAQKLGTETIAFLVQTVSDAHAIWVHRGDAVIRTLEYVRDEGGWLKKTGEPQPWEAAYFAEAEDDEPSSTLPMIAVCDQLGVAGETPNATYKPPGFFKRLFG